MSALEAWVLPMSIPVVVFLACVAIQYRAAVVIRADQQRRLYAYAQERDALHMARTNADNARWAATMRTEQAYIDEQLRAMMDDPINAGTDTMRKVYDIRIAGALKRMRDAR